MTLFLVNYFCKDYISKYQGYLLGYYRLGFQHILEDINISQLLLCPEWIV